MNKEEIKKKIIKAIDNYFIFPTTERCQKDFILSTLKDIESDLTAEFDSSSLYKNYLLYEYGSKDLQLSTEHKWDCFFDILSNRMESMSFHYSEDHDLIKSIEQYTLCKYLPQFGIDSTQIGHQMKIIANYFIIQITDKNSHLNGFTAPLKQLISLLVGCGLYVKVDSEVWKLIPIYYKDGTEISADSLMNYTFPTCD